ncbi:MAG TPA: tetratricopeptide repeat protein [Steroidobacteraceae bacterium]|nr:tetratricopeptide repeat protein [Steroidobacteraceae bacterium]
MINALLDRGQLEEALAALRGLLDKEPGNVRALVACANTLCALGRPKDALPLYTRALEIDPRGLEARNNLGNAFQELGEYEQAAACYRQALEIEPDDPEIHCNLGNALRRLGRLDEAVASAQRAIALDSRQSLAHNNLGLALAALGRRAEAVASLRRAVHLNPRFPEALRTLANLLSDMGEYEEAVSLHRTALGLDPQSADGHCQLGIALSELGRVAEATASFRRALELRPDYARAHLGLATVLRLQWRTAEAEASVRAVLATHPDDVAALHLLGDLHVDRGDFAQAQPLFQRARTLDANYAPVFCSIAAHRRMTADDSDWLQAAEALLAKPLPLAHEIGVRYALGKYHDDLRRYDEAFGEYRRANELSRHHEPAYDGTKLAQHIDNIMGRCDGEFVRRSHAGASAADLPVFVIGMPRSGTSLIEQILASHPDAYGVGEVRFWDRAYESLARGTGDAGASAIAGAARDYLEQLRTLAGPARRVVDKMPANFLYAGVIHAALPRARIIHMLRDPLDTCLSIYFQNFFRLQAYANDLESLAHYYGEYVRIAAHWRAVLPSTTLLEVPYEALIEDQEYWTRRILDFIGLPWDPKCLDFHRTDRVVITASRWQVRQRISARSIGRWRNYEKYLEPLLPLVKLARSRGSGGGAG